MNFGRVAASHRDDGWQRRRHFQGFRRNGFRTTPQATLVALLVRKMDASGKAEYRRQMAAEATLATRL